MATAKYSDRAVAGTLDGSEITVVVQGGNSRRTTTAAIANTATQLAGFATGAFAGASSQYTFDKQVQLTGYLSGNIQTLTGAGAVDVTSFATNVITTGANALTLADGVQGQLKFIVMTAFVGNGTLTPTNLGGGTTLTFNAVADSVLLQFISTKWWVISNNSVVLA